VRITPPLTSGLATHPALAHPLFSALRTLRHIDKLHDPPPGSQPAYIRHLALLI
jgi:hypothetical protein